MIRSMGSGKMIVEFFSAEMEFSVCKRGGHGSISTGTESDKSNASKGASIYNVQTEEGGSKNAPTLQTNSTKILRTEGEGVR